MLTLKAKHEIFERWLSRLRLYLWVIGALVTALTYILNLPLILLALIAFALLSLIVTVITVSLQIYYRRQQLPLPNRSTWSTIAISCVTPFLFFMAIWYYVTIYQVNQLFEAKLPGFSFISV